MRATLAMAGFFSTPDEKDPVDRVLADRLKQTDTTPSEVRVRCICPVCEKPQEAVGQGDKYVIEAHVEPDFTFEHCDGSYAIVGKAHLVTTQPDTASYDK